MSKKLITAGWIGLAVAVIGMLGFIGYYISINEPVAPDQTTTSEFSDEEIAESLQALIEEDEEQKANSNDIQITMDSVRDNGQEFGLTQLTTENGTTGVEVLASLGDPQLNSVYQAWVIKESKPFKLGTLTKEVENTYTLSKDIGANLSATQESFVTEESLAGSTDNEPGTIVLEGNLEGS